jgi:hypothetical protein
MSYELQKTLATKFYKAIDLHEFAKMCRYIDQTLRDVNNKFKISEKILLIMLNVKRSVSSSIRIKTLINRSHAHDLKSLNRVLVRLLNHQKIRWTVSTATIAKNSIISFAIIDNLERWIRTSLYEKWMCMKRMTHRVKRIISSSIREKSSSHQRRDEERAWCQNVEN